MTNNIFARARTYASLTPAERALLKLVEGLICAALVAALPVVAEALGHGAMDWSAIVRAALAAASVAILLALTKYARAQSDPALANLLAPATGADPAPATETTGTTGALAPAGTTGASQPDASAVATPAP